MKLNRSRRHFLQGISLGTGAAVLSPVLQQVAADAANKDAAKKDAKGSAPAPAPKKK